MLPLLRDGSIDFAVAGAMEGSLDPDLAMQSMGEMEMMVACRPGHPLARARQWSEVVDAQWVVHLGPGTHHSAVNRLLQERGLPLPGRVTEVNSFGVSWAMVTRGDALLILPGSASRASPPMTSRSCGCRWTLESLGRQR